MVDQLHFEQRSAGLWLAELDDGAYYRIQMYPGRLRPDYDLTFAGWRPSTRSPRGLSRRYEAVSVHRSLERAIERANRHHRGR